MTPRKEQAEKRRELSRTWRGPKAECECGHYGDGSDTEHSNTFEKGHGRCLVPGCGCPQFVWIKWAERFAKALELVA